MHRQRNDITTGLNALANCSRHYPHSWLMGHVGAAILTGAFMLQDQQLDAETTAAIRALMDDKMSGQEKLCQPFDNNTVDIEVALATRLAPLLATLSRCVSRLSVDGHGVIYAALALKALHRQPQLASESMIAAIDTLLQSCLSDKPNRYYGIDDYRELVIADHQLQRFDDPEQAAIAMLTLHDDVRDDLQVDGEMYYLASSRLHLITHSQALLELSELGYRQQAQTGLEALSRQRYVIDRSQQLFIASSHATPRCHSKQRYHPSHSGFWQHPEADAHLLKLGYALQQLLPRLSREQQQGALQGCSIHVELLI